MAGRIGLARNGRLGAFVALFLAGLGMLFAGAIAQEDAGARPTGTILTLDGAVTPASAGYIAREIAAADAAGKDLVVLKIDTPGGLVDSMKTIIKAILASDTPVATYVFPQGARSASAGVYIMYASHVAAMAPYTNTGAATPVEVGGGAPREESPFEGEDPFPEKPAPVDIDPSRIENPAPTDGGAGPEAAEETREEVPALANDDAMRAKVINDSVAYIRALAEGRGRNADWAESAVREAVSITADEALKLGVVEIVAEDLDDLMRQLDGRVVTVASGEKTIRTTNIILEEVKPTFLETLLNFIADPNVAVILMSLATTGIIIEMWNPGSIFPGAMGLTCLILGLYAFQVLPFSWLGAALMLVGALLILIEAYTPTFGLAGVFGLMLFAGGLYVLFPEGYKVSPGLIGMIVAGVGAFLGLILVALVGSRSHGPLIGAEAIRRREGVVDDWDGKEGHVIVDGERWRARSDKPLKPGDRIRVVEIEGLVLIVRQAKAGFLGVGGGGQPAAEAA